MFQFYGSEWIFYSTPLQIVPPLFHAACLSLPPDVRNIPDCAANYHILSLLKWNCELLEFRFEQKWKSQLWCSELVTNSMELSTTLEATSCEDTR
jgi:hypothetical protein